MRFRSGSFSRATKPSLASPSLVAAYDGEGAGGGCGLGPLPRICCRTEGDLPRPVRAAREGHLQHIHAESHVQSKHSPRTVHTANIKSTNPQKVHSPHTVPRLHKQSTWSTYSPTTAHIVPHTTVQVHTKQICTATCATEADSQKQSTVQLLSSGLWRPISSLRE